MLRWKMCQDSWAFYNTNKSISFASSSHKYYKMRFYIQHLHWKSIAFHISMSRHLFETLMLKRNGILWSIYRNSIYQHHYQFISMLFIRKALRISHFTRNVLLLFTPSQLLFRRNFHTPSHFKGSLSTHWLLLYAWILLLNFQTK